ncbi:MAG: TAXI family TRAP transporter solute-binding subunit [Desulfobacterales bacterium]|nr:TAXI family TRAP transporter solute-binding subunit [Desulfobacterales bacterium]
MTRVLYIILYTAVLGFVAGFLPGSASSQTPHPMVQVEQFSLNTKTTQYQLESAAADIIKKNHPWLRVTVIPGQTLMEGIGISEKYPPEKRRNVSFITSNLDLNAMSLGMPPYTRKFSNLRMLNFWWLNQWSLATYDPNIKSPQDLKGKTIAVRPKGGTWDYFYTFLFKDCWGIQDSVKLAPMSPGNFSNSMLTGQAAASHWGAREVHQGKFALSPMEDETRLKRKLYFISLTKEDFARGVKNSGGNPLSFGWMDVPAGAYGNGDPIQGPVGMISYSPGQGTWDIGDPEVGYAYVKTVNENRDKFAEYSPAWKNAIGGPKMNPFPTLPAEYINAGALRYYKEQGWVK